MARKQEGRFVGIDLGKRTYAVCFLEDGKAKFSSGKTFPEGRQTLYRQLRGGDTVGLEAGGMAFIMAKEIASAAGCKVIVLNPGKLAIIYRSMKKTDKEDSLKLAHLIQYMPEEQLPTVALPSAKEMRRRELVSEYRQTKRDESRIKNELHGLFLKAGITTIVKKDLATNESRQKAVRLLSGDLKARADHYLGCLDLLGCEIKRLKKEMACEASGDEAIERLQTIPGVGPVTAFAFAAHVAAERFENAAQVSNYVGLVPRVDISGDQAHYGHITKRGNGYLRGVLNQASWALVRSGNGGALKAKYEYMTVTQGKSKKKAIVAVSRKLVEMMYILLKEKTVYEAMRFKQPEIEAVKRDERERIESLAAAALSGEAA